MSGIGGIGSLSSAQWQAIDRIAQLGQAIAQNTERLSTMKRINSAKDDPSGLVQATLLQRDLAAAKAASASVTQAGSLLDTADSAAGEIATQLQEARALALDVAGGTLSSADVAAKQTELDSILKQIDSLSQTSFDGRRLLDGSSSIRTSGVDTSKIQDVDILDKSTTSDVTVTVDVTTAATQASQTYSGGALGSGATLLVTGPEGSATITLASGASTKDIADAFNSVTYLTGVTATRKSGNEVDFATVDYGSKASISIQATQGTFNLNGGGSDGTDAVATINGQTVTGDGAKFSFATNQLSAVIQVDPTAGTGAISPFTVSGDGLTFVTGPGATDTTTFGLPNLTTASLGGPLGTLASLGSGESNSLTGGNADNALHIIDAAIGEVTREQARIGGFQKYTLESSSRLLESTIQNLTSALSAVQDTNVAEETALLANNQLMQKSATEALSVLNMNSQDVLDLLKSVTGS